MFQIRAWLTPPMMRPKIVSATAAATRVDDVGCYLLSIRARCAEFLAPWRVCPVDRDRAIRRPVLNRIETGGGAAGGERPQSLHGKPSPFMAIGDQGVTSKIAPVQRLTLTCQSSFARKAEFGPRRRPARSGSQGWPY